MSNYNVTNAISLITGAKTGAKQPVEVESLAEISIRVDRDRRVVDEPGQPASPCSTCGSAIYWRYTSIGRLFCAGCDSPNRRRVKNWRLACQDSAGAFEWEEIQIGEFLYDWGTI